MPSTSITNHSPPSSVNPSSDRFTKFSITTHAIFLGGLAAVTLTPYLLARRRLSSLQRKLHELESTTRALQKDLQVNTVAGNAATTAAISERRRVSALLQEMRQEVQETMQVLPVKIKEMEVKEEERAKGEKARQSELQYLLEEAKIAREHGEAVRSLGPSLAEIAAFMYEVELWMPQVEGTSRVNGMYNSRVEQLRTSALVFQNLPRRKSMPQPKK